MPSPTRKPSSSLAEQERQLPLTRDVMLARMYECDETADGNFVTGVISTGIYCLPSCPARKPRPENVVFFANRVDARSAGLRACRRCHPDAFYDNHDPDREVIERAVARVRANPGPVTGITDWADLAGYGVAKLNRLAVDHYGRPLGALLTQLRIEAAQNQLLHSDLDILEIANAVGFRSTSTFYHQFKRATGQTPAQYRRRGPSEAGRRPER